MRFHPIANTIKDIMRFEYEKELKKYEKNLMRCVFIDKFTQHREYIDGYFCTMDYDSYRDELRIFYIVERFPSGHINMMPDMDERCFVTFNGKKYNDMLALYQAYQAYQLSKEIDKALEY
jgi:hypothetical protein